MMRKSELDQAKQVRGKRASAGLQVKWRQVVK